MVFKLVLDFSFFHVEGQNVTLDLYENYLCATYPVSLWNDSQFYA